MSCKQACILVLALHTWSAVVARPSDAAASTLLDRDTLIARCGVSRPDIMATPQQIVGEWCKMESTVVGEVDNTTGAYQACVRYAYSYDGQDLRVNLTIAHEGKIHRSNQTFSPFDNESWMSTGPRPNILFFGFLNDGQYLFTRVCKAHGPDTQDTDNVYEMIVPRCLQQGEISQTHPGSRPDIVGCSIPVGETTAEILRT